MSFSASKIKKYKKRNYKLTANVRLNLWMDFLKSELEAYRLLDVIEDNENVIHLLYTLLNKQTKEMGKQGIS